MLGMKCVSFGCWQYTCHKSGLCVCCRTKIRHPALAPKGTTHD